MEILLVKIEHKESLPLNEFFDYGGKCYAITQSREAQNEVCIDFSRFFEASVNTERMEHVPVVFLDSEGRVIGWYRDACVQKTLLRPSLFLEGNIVAAAKDAVLLPERAERPAFPWYSQDVLYDVVENDDERFEEIRGLVDGYKGENVFLRYEAVIARPVPAAVKTKEACSSACVSLGTRILEDTCRDISEIKLLEAYAKRLTQLNANSADGYYYLAMAQYQLGFPKKGMKAIERALRLEPEAPDLLVLKGMLLCSMGYAPAAAECFAAGFEKTKDEQYLLLQGRAYLRCQKAEEAYRCFREIKDPKVLEQAGIRLEEEEKKWSFAGIGRTLSRLLGR